MLNVSSLSFSYGSIRTLTDIDLSAEKGRVTCVLGRNGVGKTTLLKNIVGLLRPSSGTVSTESEDLTKKRPSERAKSGVGYVPQGRQIFPKLTVEENLRIGLEARTDRRTTIPDEVFDLFPVLREMLGRFGGDLSGGQQQQLAIARALVGDPRVLLLDEPTEGIQPNVIQEIGAVLRDLAEERGMTIVLVEQYLDFVKEFGSDFYILKRGRVVASGETDGLSAELVRQHLSV